MNSPLVDIEKQPGRNEWTCFRCKRVFIMLGPGFTKRTIFYYAENQGPYCPKCTAQIRKEQADAQSREVS